MASEVAVRKISEVYITLRTKRHPHVPRKEKRINLRFRFISHKASMMIASFSQW
jgi:hypothetical protein